MRGKDNFLRDFANRSRGCRKRVGRPSILDEREAEILQNRIETLCSIDSELRTRTGQALSTVRHVLGS